MDIAARLKEVRNDADLTQKQLGERSGVGDKTLSSFESGRRTKQMKIGQLMAILAVIGMTLTEFFEGVTDRPPQHAEETPAFALFDRFMALPPETQTLLLPAFAMLIDIVTSKRLYLAPADPLHRTTETKRKAG